MSDPQQSAPLTEEAQKSMALDAILDAWEAATAKGVAPELLASTAIFAALADMVDGYGEEPVAQMCETLPDRVRRGEFTIEKS